LIQIILLQMVDLILSEPRVRFRFRFFHSCFLLKLIFAVE
jgi:hypothetical protein